MPLGLGTHAAALLAYAQHHGLREVRCGDLHAPLGMTPGQEVRALARLHRRGIIARVRPGLYLVPSRLPPGGRWTPDQATAIHTLMTDRGARYQITGPGAFFHHGFTTRMPTCLHVYNDRISGQRRVGLIALTLIKVRASRLGGIDLVRSSAGFEVPVSSRARTLVDALTHWSRFGSLPDAYDWIRAELAGDELAGDELAGDELAGDELAGDELTGGELTGDELVEAAVAYGNQGALRRLGVVLEACGAQERHLRALERCLTSPKSQIAFWPHRPKRGRLIKRWGVSRNDEWG